MEFLKKVIMLLVVVLGMCAVQGQCRDNYSTEADSSASIIAVDYTPYLSEVIYSTSNGSVPKFDPRGMQPLYVVTNKFIELVGSSLKQDIPPDLLPAEDGNVGDVYSYVKQWLLFEREIVICAGIGLGLAILVPLVGIFFCCCRCCGRCGAAPEKTDSRSDPCHCGTLTAIFLLLSLIITFGVVCAFVTNEYQKQAVNNVNKTFDSSIDDLKLYLRNSQKHASHVLKNNFKELETHIKETLNVSEVRSEKEFENGENSVGADNLFSFAQRLADADVDIRQLNGSFSRLKSLEAILNQNISTIRSWMTELVIACKNQTGLDVGSPCSDIATARDNLRVVVDFSDLSLSSALADFENRIDPNVIAAIREARTKLTSVKDNLRGNVRNASDVIKDKLEEARTTVLGIELQIREMARDADMRLTRTDEIITPYFDYVRQYNQYIWYGKLAVSVTMLTILFMFIMAILFGICGSRSGTLYEDPFCNKGKGSCWMMCGVSWIFILYFFLMVTATALFIIGSNVQLLGCDTISNPSSNNHLRALTIVLRQYKISDLDLAAISTQLEKCNQNQAIYQVLGLNNTLGNQSVLENRLRSLDSLPVVSDIVEDANRRISETRFFSTDQKSTLLNLANSPFLQQMDLDPLKRQLSSEDVILKNSVDQITNGTKLIEPLIQEDNRAAGLTFSIHRELDNLQRTVVPEIRKEMSKSLDILNNLTTLLVNGNASQSILQFINDTEEAEKKFHQKSGVYIKEIANDTLDDLKRYIDEYLNYSLSEIKNRVGQCEPASAAINRTVNAICKDVLYPFNGFWLSVGWSLILLIPALPIAIALAWHFRIPESYRSGSSDSDFEPAVETDTIPLAHRNGRKRIHPSSSENSAYDSRARQSKATQWAFHNAFKQPNGYYPVRKGTNGPTAPTLPLPDDSIYTRPPSYYYPGSNN